MTHRPRRGGSRFQKVGARTGEFILPLQLRLPQPETELRRNWLRLLRLCRDPKTAKLAAETLSCLDETSRRRDISAKVPSVELSDRSDTVAKVPEGEAAQKSIRMDFLRDSERAEKCKRLHFLRQTDACVALGLLLLEAEERQALKAKMPEAETGNRLPVLSEPS